MRQQTCPVDVIAVYRANGDICPLRFRMEDENRQQFRVNIDEVVSRKDINYIGAEAYVFLCRATVWEKRWTFELKYVIRTHTWSMLRTIS